MRHGQAISNVRDLCSSWPEKFKNPLTKAGRKMVEDSAKTLLDKKIDLIFASPLLRTKQTSQITGKILGIKPKPEKRLREVGFGIFSGQPLSKMWNYFEDEQERIGKNPPSGETYSQTLERISGFVKEIDKKYKNKIILLVSHDCPLTLLQGWVSGLSIEQTIKEFPLNKRIHKAEIRQLN